MRKHALSAAVTVVACLFLACEEKKPAPPPVVDAGPPVHTVSVLVTGHETGHLITSAPRLLAQWRKNEKWPDAIALSTGDMFAGQSISSHFLGIPTAEVMKAMQYRAGALGNHDLDLGPEALEGFRATSEVALLAANLKDRPDADKPLKPAPFTVIQREGVKVGVVGLTSEKTITTVVAGRASGLELVPTDSVLPGALDGVRKAGAEVVVVLLDDCFSGLAKQFEAHPDWKADLVVGSRCDGANEQKVRDVTFFSVGDDLSAYVAARIDVVGDKVTVKASRKDFVDRGDEDADLVQLRTRWQTKLDLELGAVVGYSKTGIKEDAAELRTLVATAMRDETKSDASLINRKGIRAELPKGSITAAHVYSMIPFDNAVLTVMVKGEDLLKLKANPEAVMALPAAKIEPGKTYQLATTEYLYFGGDGLGLEAVAPNPELTGQIWQTPVVTWIKKQGSNEKKPLEKLIK